jgi:hypothetical protein
MVQSTALQESGGGGGERLMLTKFGIDLGSDIAGLIGGILLVKPAWRAIRFAKRVSELDKIELTDSDDAVIHKLRDIAREKTEARITTWERSDELAVLCGIGLVTFSFGIKILWAAVMGPEMAH